MVELIENPLKYTRKELEEAIEFFARNAFSIEIYEGRVHYVPYGIKKVNHITEEDFKLIYPIEKKEGSFVDSSTVITRSVPYEEKLAEIKDLLGEKRFFITYKIGGTLREYEIRNPRQLVNLYRKISHQLNKDANKEVDEKGGLVGYA
jgi:hypothetical protein